MLLYFRALVALLAYDAVRIVQGSMCTGLINVAGHGPVALTNAGANTPGTDVGSLELLGGQVVAHMNARTYFGDSCLEGFYSNTKYSAFQLLGKKLTYTTDVSDAGCGCNAAFYLVSMRQNPEISSCNDYYCDANKVCGVSCAEIDIQEANNRAWHSTLHGATDHSGKGSGYGGGDTWNGARDFTSAQYGPGSPCIDTTLPFDVEVAFPVDSTGQLQAMEVTLTQTGRNCPVKMAVRDYAEMAQLSDALAAGMTPVISYWKSADMLWMDGKGADQQGPCAVDDQQCGVAVKFYDFRVEPLPAPKPPPMPAPAPFPVPLGPPVQPQPVVNVPSMPAQPNPAREQGGKVACTSSGQDCRTSKCCSQPGFQCYQKNKWWASCKAFCEPGIDPTDTPENQKPWSCKPLGPRAAGTAKVHFKEVVVKIPADGFPGSLAKGNSIVLGVGEQEFHGKVVSIKDVSEIVGSAAPIGIAGGGGGGGSGLPVFLVVCGLTLLGIGLYAHLRPADWAVISERLLLVAFTSWEYCVHGWQVTKTFVEGLRSGTTQNHRTSQELALDERGRAAEGNFWQGGAQQQPQQSGSEPAPGSMWGWLRNSGGAPSAHRTNPRANSRPEQEQSRISLMW